MKSIVVGLVLMGCTRWESYEMPATPAPDLNKILWLELEEWTH